VHIASSLSYDYTAGAYSKPLNSAATQEHGLDKVSAAIHVQLGHLTVQDKARLAKLSVVQMKEVEGEIMLRVCLIVLCGSHSCAKS
jgi:hypothetical protein